MSNPKRNLPHFLSELKRRRVPRSLLVYLASGFAVLEASDILIPVLGLPAWTLRAVVALLILGLPSTVVVSWFYDLTSQGLVHTPLSYSPGPEAQTGGDHALGRGQGWLSPGSIGLIVSLVLVGVVGGWFLEPAVRGGSRITDDLPGPSDGRPSLAVLPWENLSPDEENIYFADAIHEEVISNLSRVGDLKVIPRLSVLEYREQGGKLRQIADELGVTAIATGTVQRADERVRVIVHLIDPVTEEELWGETYNRTVDDIFAIQADIARSVAAALAASLSPQEEARLEAAPSENTEAYLFYISGAESLTRAIHTLDPSGLEGAVESLERAVALDSTFALAHAVLSVALEFSHRVAENVEKGVEFSRRAGEAADRALSLAPKLAEAHHAIALHGSRTPGSEARTQEDIGHLRTAFESLPNNAAILRELAVRFERLGRMEEAAEFSLRAADLVPRSALYQHQAAEHARLMGDFEQAERRLVLADGLASGAPEGLTHIYRTRILLEFSRGGGVAGAQEVFLEEAQRVALTPLAIRGRLEEFPELLVGGAQDEFVAGLSPTASDPGLRCNCYDIKAWMHTLAGRGDLARPYWDSLSNEARTEAPPSPNPWGEALERARAAVVLARAGDTVGAMEVLEDTFLPVERSPAEWEFRHLRAEVFASLGDVETAVEDLEVLLRSPTGITAESLRARLPWDPIRDHPSFQSLMRQ